MKSGYLRLSLHGDHPELEKAAKSGDPLSFRLGAVEGSAAVTTWSKDIEQVRLTRHVKRKETTTTIEASIAQTPLLDAPLDFVILDADGREAARFPAGQEELAGEVYRMICARSEVARATGSPPRETMIAAPASRKERRE